MDQTLRERRAFVTGGSRGIGAAIVRRLVDDGARVVFTYSSSPSPAYALSDELEGRAIAVQADSGDSSQLREAVALAAKTLGGIDILVNNAGILKLNDISAFSDEDFERMVAVNVRGVFVATQAALAHMGKGGRIVTIGSVSGDYAHVAGGSIYTLTKGAVAAFTRGLAHDLAKREITANTVQPGPTETDIVAPEMHEVIRSMMPIGRMGKAREVAALVSWLCREEAAFVTGAAITIDGGFSA